VTFDYEPVDSSGERVEQVVALTWFLPRELRTLLTANGFRRVELLAGYRRGAVRNDSRRQVVFAWP
jgi:hypothetical protein